MSKKFDQRDGQSSDFGGVVDSMLIVPPMTFAQWINDVRTGEIFLDSGMYFDPIKPNDRPSQTGERTTDIGFTCS